MPKGSRRGLAVCYRAGPCYALGQVLSLSDLLTYTLGTGMVPAEPGTFRIADAL